MYREIIDLGSALLLQFDVRFTDRDGLAGVMLTPAMRIRRSSVNQGGLCWVGMAAILAVG
jgi:hypothetical protein